MDYQALAEEMLRTLYVLNKARPQRKMHDCLRGEGFVLQYIIFQEGPVQPNEISSFMNISTARIAAALNSLERKGLVTRRIDPDDRRRILVELTEEGKTFADEQRKGMLNHITEMMERLGEEDAVEFTRLMKKVSTIYTETHPEHSAFEGDGHDPFLHHHWHRH